MSRLQKLTFPGLAQNFTLGDHILLGFIETLENALPLDRLAGAATGHEVCGAFLPAVSMWKHEINGHYQRVFKAGPAVQTAILTTEVVALHNLQALGRANGNVRPRVCEHIQRHMAPPFYS
jgi:hypothetical protein